MTEHAASPWPKDPEPGDYAMWRYGGRPLVHIVADNLHRTMCGRAFYAPSMRHATEDEANARPCAKCWEAM